MSPAVVWGSLRGFRLERLGSIGLRHVENLRRRYERQRRRSPATTSTPAAASSRVSGVRPPAIPTPPDHPADPNGGIAVAIGNTGKVVGNYDVSGSGSLASLQHATLQLHLRQRRQPGRPLLRRTNQRLEDVARRRLRGWHVDFASICRSRHREGGSVKRAGYPGQSCGRFRRRQIDDANLDARTQS